MSPRALVYVQHLLGIGHFARIGRIARSLAEAGMRTTVAQGGTETGLPRMEGVETVQLTPVRVTVEDMSTLLHADGRLFIDADKAARRDQLLETLRDVRPDILLISCRCFKRRGASESASSPVRSATCCRRAANRGGPRRPSTP
jgi:predicted glycosyltransferase